MDFLVCSYFSFDIPVIFEDVVVFSGFLCMLNTEASHVLFSGTFRCLHVSEFPVFCPPSVFFLSFSLR